MGKRLHDFKHNFDTFDFQLSMQLVYQYNRLTLLLKDFFRMVNIFAITFMMLLHIHIQREGIHVFQTYLERLEGQRWCVSHFRPPTSDHKPTQHWLSLIHPSIISAGTPGQSYISQEKQDTDRKTETEKLNPTHT